MIVPSLILKQAPPDLTSAAKGTVHHDDTGILLLSKATSETVLKAPEGHGSFPCRGTRVLPVAQETKWIPSSLPSPLEYVASTL